MFRRPVTPSTRNPEILVDSQLGDAAYVDSFGFEWTAIDGFAGKEVMSHGHIFGRFLLSPHFFTGKKVVDIGCGNGRIGRLIAPFCASYCGVDLSEAIYAFPRYIKKPPEFTLVRASGTDLPLDDAVADITVCWGVVHHMNDPDAGLAELLRVTKPGGVILIFVYTAHFDFRANLNAFVRGLPADRSHALLDELSDQLDSWREVDSSYAERLAGQVGLGFRHSREWQKFQWFDGITPRYHWSLDKRIAAWAEKVGRRVACHRPGCFYIEK